MQVRQNVPRVSYISYLDIWMLLCMLFVFSCILEFIMATALLRTGKKEKAEKVISDILEYKAQEFLFQFENISKLSLPALFLLLNIVYWPALLAGYWDGK